MKKYVFAIVSYTGDSQAERAIAVLSRMVDDLLWRYQNKKGIYYVYSILIEKHSNMWYGRVLELPQVYTRSCFNWLCILKLKIMCRKYV